MQIQLLILQIEKQLVIITAMIDRLRRRWGLQQGQRRPRSGGTRAHSMVVPLLLVTLFISLINKLNLSC